MTELEQDAVEALRQLAEDIESGRVRVTSISSSLNGNRAGSYLVHYESRRVVDDGDPS